jgi:hypothetical protein
MIEDALEERAELHRERAALVKKLAEEETLRQLKQEEYWSKTEERQNDGREWYAEMLPEERMDR